MKVIEHQPAHWFFLKSDDGYYLYVNCSRSFVGFSVAILLAEEEVKHYNRDGKQYIQDLANQVSNKSDPNHPRNIRDDSILKNIRDSIKEWNNQ